MKTCYVVGAGPVNVKWLEKQIPKNAFVIGVDGGFQTLHDAGIEPKLFVGDGDSTEIPEIVDVIRFPTKKDSTDMQEAIEHAITLGYQRIYMLGVTRGRQDHFFGNIGLLERIDRMGNEGIILDEQNKIYFHSGGEKTYKQDNRYRYASVVPVDEVVTGVTLEGFAYPLTDFTLRRYDTRGVSNTIVKPEVTVSTKSGKALFIQSIDAEDLDFI